MKVYILTLIALSALIVCKKHEEEENELLVLTKSNFKGYVSQNKHFFVLFHSPWCKWSQRLQDVLLETNLMMKMEAQPFYLGYVDTTIEDYKGIVSQHFTNGLLTKDFTFPKLVYFLDGVPNEIYTNKFSFSKLLVYLKRKIHTSSIKFTLPVVFEAKIEKDKLAVIFYGDFAKAESEDFEIFNKLARNTTEYMFYHTNSEEVITKYNPQRFKIVIYSFGKEVKSHTKQESFSLLKLKQSIKKAGFKNFFRQFREDAIENVFIQKHSALILFRNKMDNTTKLIEDHLPFISRYEPTLSFIISDLVGKYEQKLARLFGVTEENLPQARIVDFKTGKMSKFSYSGPLNYDDLVRFVQNWKKGRITPYFSSIIEEQSKLSKNSLVSQITGAEYNNKVLSNSKHVVVFFKASWCTHCIRYAITFEAVSKRFKTESYSFITIELMQPEFYDLRITKVPTIMLFASMKKDQPIEFKNKINTIVLSKFIEQHTSEKQEL